MCVCVSVLHTGTLFVQEHENTLTESTLSAASESFEGEFIAHQCQCQDMYEKLMEAMEDIRAMFQEQLVQCSCPDHDFPSPLQR